MDLKFNLLNKSFINKVLIAAIIIVLLILFSSNNLTQNNTNLRFYGNITNNYLTGFIKLNNNTIENQYVTFVLNNRLTETYLINQNGHLLLYVPLSLGFNNLDIIYKNYSTELHMLYLGDIADYAVLLIGILAYLVITDISNSKEESYKAKIRYDDIIRYQNSDDNLYNLIKRTIRISKNNRITKGMAVKIDEVARSLGQYKYNKNDRNKDNLIRLYTDNIINKINSDSRFKGNYIADNMISTIRDPLRSIISRKIYELAINEDKFKIDKNILSANNIILLEELPDFIKSVKTINSNSYNLEKENKEDKTVASKTVITVLSSKQNKKFLNIITGYNENSALLLFLKLSKQVDVLAI
ncbi:MAG: hypothetical protein ACP5RI_03080 [Candidatus Micrarchaeia archaeon]